MNNKKLLMNILRIFLVIALICSLTIFCLVGCEDAPETPAKPDPEIVPDPGPEPEPDPDPAPAPNPEVEALTALNASIAEALPDNAPDTPHEIMMILGAANVDFEPFWEANQAAGHKMGMDITTKRFVIIDPNNLGAITTKENIFVPVMSAQDYTFITTNGFSLYLIGEFSGTEIALTGAGLDVGANTNIETITYTGGATAHSVLIRSNSGTLTINAANDTVKHYGEGSVLTITAIADESYHEYGKFLKASIAQGHIVLEEGADIDRIIVSAATETVKITANEGTIITVDEASESNTTIVANSEEVYVDGSVTIEGTKSADVVQAIGVESDADFVNAMTNGGFYKLSASFTLSSEVTLASGKAAIVDFAGQTITYASNWRWINNGSLTLIDSVGDGGVTCGKGIVDNYGTLVVYGGTFETSVINSGAALWNNPDATMIIYDCEITAARSAVINNAHLIINGGIFNSTSTSENGSGNYGYCVISEGAGATMEINGGTVSGIHGAISVSSGSAVINDVTAYTKDGDSYSYYALYVAGEEGEAECTINGGTFTGGYRTAAHIGNKNKNGDGGIGASAYVTINGGTFTGYGTNPAYVVSFSEDDFGCGYTFISGGTFNSEPAAKDIIAGHEVVNNGDGTWTVK